VSTVDPHQTVTTGVESTAALSGHAARIARDHCLAPERVDAPIYGGRYRKLFPELPALDVDEQALRALGRAGGPCDVGVELADGPDSTVAAVWPFFGQFVAHDITADRSPLGHRSDPDEVRNFRTPRANLEGVYGAGPVGSPYLYAKNDPAKLLLGPSGSDVARNQEGIALLGDPRNDVHLFMSQMQVAFVKLHNRLVDRLRADGVEDGDLFDEARRAATWHYQHVIVREFLPLLVGADLVEELLESGPRYYRADGHIPFEFADAAYRYGHSQIRQRYQVNAELGPCPVFPDLLGFGPVAPEHLVDWSLQIDLRDRPPAQRAKKIDGRLPASLIALPTEITGEREGSEFGSLATRDLERGEVVGLASGEAVARALEVEPLSGEQLALAEYGWTDETPLWLYILKEAETRQDGNRLGPVGARIVGEVLIGIIDADAESYRAIDPSWQPTLPAGHGDVFGLADILEPVEEPG
jgi:hypothetical protein